MKSGDVVQVLQYLVLDLMEVYDYYDQDSPMNTIKELEALVDEIEATTKPASPLPAPSGSHQAPGA